MPPKPKNLQRLRLRLETPIPETVEEIPAYLRSLQRETNEHLQRIEKAFADQSGHSGAVGVAADIDMQGHSIINAGKAKKKNAIPTKEQVDAIAGYSVGQAVNQFLGGVDISELLGADEILDLDVPAVVQDLTLDWKRKAGWIARYGPPINVKRTLGYYVSFFNDSAGTVWMNPDDGTTAADEREAERFVDVTHYTTNLNGNDPAEPFLSGGVKVRVTALVKIKGKGKVRGKKLDYGSLVTPGGDPGLSSATFTGTAVPKLPMALERTAVGGSIVGNTTTTFELDAGASSEPNAYVGSGEDLWVLYIPGAAAGHLNPVGIVTAYNETTKVVTVTNLGMILGGGFTYELHRGLGLAGFSSTGHSTTTLKLDHSVESRVSTVNDHYKGWTLYIPYLAAGQRIQKVTSSAYAAPIHTLTFEPAAQQVAPAAAPANNCHYLLCTGSFGYATLAGTGIIAPAPFRVWLDTDLTGKFKEEIEPIPPVDFNLTHSWAEMWKQSATKIKFYKKGKPDEPFNPDAPNYIPMIRMKFRNLYRGVPVGTSDGWSDYSYYVYGYQSTDTPTVFAPSDFPPIEIDYQAEFPII